KICHPDRSIAIDLINRNAEWRDLLFAAAMNDHQSYSVYMVASKSRVIMGRFQQLVPRVSCL
ncbi:MAG TPA: hypothetical protein VK829_16345, partial [Terriglobales bacterium]|nr:hypothetical protein [Terriglobales bacterium]